MVPNAMMETMFVIMEFAQVMFYCDTFEFFNNKVPPNLPNILGSVCTLYGAETCFCTEESQVRLLNFVSMMDL